MQDKMLTRKDLDNLIKIMDKKTGEFGKLKIFMTEIQNEESTLAECLDCFDEVLMIILF